MARSRSYVVVENHTYGELLSSDIRKRVNTLTLVGTNVVGRP